LADRAVIVSFGDGIESCETTVLTRRIALAEAARLGHWSPTLDVTLKAQACSLPNTKRPGPWWFQT